MSEYVECSLDEECVLCTGEACELCGAGKSTRNYEKPPCEHDSIDRHKRPPAAPTEPEEPR